MVLYPNKLPESERVCSGICIYSLQTDKYYNFVPKHEKPLYKTDVCYRKAT